MFMQRVEGFYIINGYRTHEDEQVGRSEKLGIDDELGNAIKFVRNYIRQTKDYQVNISDGSKKVLLYSNRCGDEYYFRDDSQKTFGYMKRHVDMLANILVAEGYIKNKWDRLTLFENNGKVYLKETYGDIIIADVFGDSCKDSIVYYVECLIRLLNTLYPSGVKSFTFVYDSNVRYYYHTNSKEERGSVDVYFDYF